MEPTFGEMEQFLVLTMQPVLVSDSVPTSRPINMPVFTPPETRLVFDTITYSKGSITLFKISKNEAPRNLININNFSQGRVLSE